MGCNHSKIACGCGNHIVDRDGKEYCLPSCQTEASIEEAEREFLRFKARQLLAIKKGHLKARGYKRNSKPASSARVHQAPTNPIKNVLGTDTIDAINDRVMTTRVDGKQVRFYESQTSAEQDSIPEEIKASASKLELRHLDARYKEVAKRFVNGVLCRALEIVARADEEHSTLSATEHSQMKEETTAIPNEKDVKIRDAVKVFVEHVIANAVDVVGAEINLSTSLQEVSDVEHTPTKDVARVDNQEIPILKDEQLGQVRVNWDDVKVIRDTEAKDFEVSGEQDDNTDLLAEGCGHVTVSLEQVRVSVDRQVNVRQEISAETTSPTTALCIQGESADTKDEENTHDMLEDKAFDKTDGRNGDQEISKIQEKELFVLDGMMEDFEKSMSYYNRLIEGTAFDEERPTLKNSQVSDSTQCREEISIVIPDDGRSLAAAEVEVRRMHEAFEREREDETTKKRTGGKTIARPSDGKLSYTSDVDHDDMEWTGVGYSANKDTKSIRETDHGRPSDTDAAAMQDRMGAKDESRQHDTEYASEGGKPLTRLGEGIFIKERCESGKMEDSNEVKQSDGDINQRRNDSPCVMQSDAIALRPIGNWRQVLMNKNKKSIRGKEKDIIPEMRGILWSESLTPLGGWSPKPFFLEDDATSRTSKEKKKKKTPSLDSVDVQKKLTKEPSNINPPPFIVPSCQRNVSSRKPSLTKMNCSHLHDRHKQEETIPSLPESKITGNYAQRPLEPLLTSLSRLSSRLTNSNHRYEYTKVNMAEDSERWDSASMMMNPALLTLRCRDETLYEKKNDNAKEYNCVPGDIAHAMEMFNHVRQVLCFDGLISTALVYKFLLARDFNVDAATSLYKNYLFLRRTYNRTDLNPVDEPLRSELFSGRFTVLDSRDQQGAAIAVFTAHLHCADISHEVVMNNIYLQLDETINSVETQRHGLVLIYDFTNITNRTCDVHLCSKILELLLFAYPVRLTKTVIVSPPFWFEVEMQLISAAFRDTKYRKNIHIVTQPGLQDHLPVRCIPVDLGGDCQANPVRLIQRCLSSYRDYAGMMEDEVE